jgi:hypothetical protein
MVSWSVKNKNFPVWNIGEIKYKKKQSPKTDDCLTVDCRLLVNLEGLEPPTF